MNRAGGEQFARAKISEYLRRMHGETSGPWILPETSTVEVVLPLARPIKQTYSFSRP